jgi:hypothetical protein
MAACTGSVHTSEGEPEREPGSTSRGAINAGGITAGTIKAAIEAVKSGAKAGAKRKHTVANSSG